MILLPHGHTNIPNSQILLQGDIALKYVGFISAKQDDGLKTNEPSKYKHWALSIEIYMI